MLLGLSLSTLFPYTTLFRSHRVGPVRQPVARRCYVRFRGPDVAGAGPPGRASVDRVGRGGGRRLLSGISPGRTRFPREDRKSTRLNSSHLGISYAVFCLKKK